MEANPAEDLASTTDELSVASEPEPETEPSTFEEALEALSRCRAERGKLQHDLRKLQATYDQVTGARRATQATHKERYLAMERRMKVAERAAKVARESAARAARALRRAEGQPENKGGVANAMSVLDWTLQVNMNPLDMSKAGSIVCNLQDAGYSVEHINAVCRAIFLSQNVEDLKTAFLVFDTTGENTISADEFRAAMSLMAEDVPEEQLDRMFADADADGSGDIDFEEFCQFVRVLKERKPNAIGLALEAVDTLDIGTQFKMRSNMLPRAGRAIHKLKGAGYSDAEINDVCAVLFLVPSDEQLKSAWRVFDGAGNGMVDALQFREAMKLMGEEDGDEMDDRLDKMFAAADADNSGEIDFEEFTVLMSSLNAAKEPPGSPLVAAISVLDFSVQVRVGPGLMGAAGRIIQRMQEDGHGQEIMNATCSAFLGSLSDDVNQKLWCLLDPEAKDTIPTESVLHLLKGAAGDMNPVDLRACVESAKRFGEEMNFHGFRALATEVHEKFHSPDGLLGSSSWL